MTIRVGVIGAGNIGTAHAHNLATAVPGSTVTAIYDVDQPAATALASELGCRSTASLADLINADDVDAVVIASPDGLHAEQALACLAVRKPTLCEKPLAPTIEAAQRVLDAEVAIGERLLTLGFMRRFDPGYVALKREIGAEGIGTPLMVHNVHRNAAFAYGLTTEGTVTNAAIHEIDINRWLLEDEYARVQVIMGRSGPDTPDGQRDPLFIIYETAGGVVVDIEAFMMARYGYEVTCQVVASDGVSDMGDGGYITRTTARVRGQPVPEQWIGRFRDAYRIEMQAWIDSIRGRAGPTGASLWDGFAATHAAEAAVESLRSDGLVRVDLPSRPDLYR
ncbi:MAG: Gfo/Idh/MocA family oxidoreductase [Acidimicrobiia bacterium]|nr:Gfo/Idh/MocA family oxidoreductase [Acidimicrobiia bacterium]